MTLVPRCSVAIVTRVLVVALVWGAVPTGAVALLGTAARAQEGQGGQEAQEAEPQVEVQVIDADDTMVVGVRVIDAEGDVEVVQGAVQAIEGISVQPAEDGQVPLDPEEQRKQAMAQQAAQLEPTLVSEMNSQLELIRTLVGEITPEARRAIVAAGEAAAKEGAARLSEAFFAPQPGQVQPQPAIRLDAGNIVAGAVRGFFGLNRRRAREEPAEVAGFDCVHHLAAALADALEEHVGDAAAREFEAQVLERAKAARQAAVRRIVVMLDDDLCLSSEQAAAIGAALEEQWDDAMLAAGSQQVFGGSEDGRKVYPGVPRRAVVPHLVPAQRERFGGVDENDMERSYRMHWARAGQINRLQRTGGFQRDPWWSP